MCFSSNTGRLTDFGDLQNEKSICLVDLSERTDSLTTILSFIEFGLFLHIILNTKSHKTHKNPPKPKINIYNWSGIDQYIASMLFQLTYTIKGSLVHFPVWLVFSMVYTYKICLRKQSSFINKTELWNFLGSRYYSKCNQFWNHKIYMHDSISCWNNSSLRIIEVKPRQDWLVPKSFTAWVK